MKKRAIILAAFITLGLLFNFMIPPSNAQCPNPDLKETAADCPWADVARTTEGMASETKIRKVLDAKIPGFMKQLEKDAQSPKLLALWGLSRNIDEGNLNASRADGSENPNYLKKTAPVNLLSYFASILKVSYNSDFTEGHAGLTHTYGYLFSNLLTAFGYKRARYVAGEIEEGFGVKPGTFSGMPTDGTLLSNLTFFAGTIAIRDQVNAVKNIGYDQALSLYDFQSLKPKRLIELVTNEKFNLEIRTDIVPFTHANTRGSNAALLIYSIDFHLPTQPSRPKLITVFPVDANFAAGIFNPKNLGDNKKLKLSYNAVLPVSVSAEELVGKRFIQNEGN